MTLRAGHLVYRVLEDDPPGEGPFTWKVAAVVVEHASAKQIKLKTYFSGRFRVKYDSTALGRVFFETPLQAIQHFLIEQRLEVESLDRRRTEAARAVAWAVDQEGMKP